ncbi:hypothetical protein ABV23_RS00615 [Escherichia coli]|nr:hypothetical protein [Escherichia coli]
MSTILTVSQSVALTDLLNALSRCTEVGLFDVVDVAPDVINHFCDAMEECKEDDSRMMAATFEEVQPGEIKGLPVLKK